MPSTSKSSPSNGRHSTKPSPIGMPGRVCWRRPLSTSCAASGDAAALALDLLRHVERLAPALHAVLPDPVEIGDERLNRLGFLNRLGCFGRGELVERDVYAGLAPAPAAPRAAGAEDAERPRQVIGLVPTVEARAVGFGHFRAHRQIGLRHPLTRLRA